MRITFELQGVERVIKNDKYCYMPLIPGTERILGYYSSLGGAVLRHISDANIPEEQGQEEIIELKSYVERFEALRNEIRGVEVGDVFRSIVIEGEKRDLTAQKESLKKYHESRKKIVNPDTSTEVEPLIETSDDEDDI